VKPTGRRGRQLVLLLSKSLVFSAAAEWGLELLVRGSW
jgi:hypothetical protein